ncbi:MAG TPA: MFS transporter [Streptosporangiaceae bacterium]|nr:MFS transporter [Streptosporangiaceae bacterium]
MTSGVDETTRPAAIAPALAAEGQPASLSALGLMTVLIGVFLPMTDFFIVNVALPTIDRDLHAPAGMLQLVVAGYAIAYALLLVVGGRLGDAVGRKRLFLAGMAAFTVTSLACGVAPGIGALVAARALQGAASAMMLPQVLSTIQATRTGPARARALGSYGATGGIAVVAGQLLGGLLVSANIGGMSWRPIFLVNVPVGIAGLILASRLVPDTRSDDPAPVDRRGTLLLGWATLALLIPLTEGRSLGWPLWTIAALITAPVAAVAFVRAERAMEERGGVPLVPISLLRVPSMRRGLLLAVPFFTGFGGFMFVIALTLQDGRGITALDAGVILVPMALGFLAASLSTARLLPRFGRHVLTAGALIQSAGLLAIIAELARTWPHPTALWMAPGMVVLGIGQGLIMSPLFGAVLSEVPPRRAGVGSGVLATTQQTALALGVATLGSLYLTIAVPGTAGPDGAASLILGILVLNALGVGVMSRRLPVLR